MKNSIILLLTAFTLFSCSKDDNKPQTLPEATQTGRGIFACYVDGKPFIDNSGTPNGISFNCFYQLVDGKYYFGISGENNVNTLKGIFIGTDNVQLQNEMIYNLMDYQTNSIWGGGFFVINPTESDSSNTNNDYTGELYITKFDLQNHIVSGTFWFDIQNPYTNETVKITEGRFDTHFGQ